MMFKLFDEKQDSVASILFHGFDKLKRKKIWKIFRAIFYRQIIVTIIFTALLLRLAKLRFIFT